MLLSAYRWCYLHIDTFYYLHLDSFGLADAALQPQFYRPVVTYLPDLTRGVPFATRLPHLALQFLLLQVHTHTNHFIILERLTARLPRHLFNDQFYRLELLLPLLVVA